MIEISKALSISNAWYTHLIAQVYSHVCVKFPNVSIFKFNSHWCRPLVCPLLVGSKLLNRHKKDMFLTHCCGASTPNSAWLPTGLFLCQDISHLHSQSTLAGLPSHGAVLKLTREKFWGIGSKKRWNIYWSVNRLNICSLETTTSSLRDKSSKGEKGKLTFLIAGIQMCNMDWARKACPSMIPT